MKKLDEHISYLKGTNLKVIESRWLYADGKINTHVSYKDGTQSEINIYNFGEKFKEYKIKSSIEYDHINILFNNFDENTIYEALEIFSKRKVQPKGKLYKWIIKAIQNDYLSGAKEDWGYKLKISDYKSDYKKPINDGKGNQIIVRI
jgi:hypothetical protein